MEDYKIILELLKKIYFLEEYIHVKFTGNKSSLDDMQRFIEEYMPKAERKFLIESNNLTPEMYRHFDI